MTVRDHKGIKVGDRVRDVEPVRVDGDDGGYGTVLSLGQTLGKVGVKWDEIPEIVDWVWPEDLAVVDAVTRLGEIDA